MDSPFSFPKHRLIRLSGITVTITEPERKSLLQFARASPASRASFCYVAISFDRGVF
jgi:hypothetical protein